MYEMKEVDDTISLCCWSWYQMIDDILGNKIFFLQKRFSFSLKLHKNKRATRRKQLTQW